jgi:hypothetical protein
MASFAILAASRFSTRLSILHRVAKSANGKASTSSKLKASPNAMASS